MNYWHQIPIVRLIIPFITGILLALYLERAIALVYYVLPVLILVYVVFVLLFSKKITHRNNWLLGILQNLILVLAGYSLLILNIPRFHKNDISQYQDLEMIHVSVIEQISEKENSFKIVTKVKAVKDSVNWIKTSGKLLFYFQKDTICPLISFGDELLISAQLNEIGGPQNPGEFNYKRYLNNKGIYYQAYVKSGNWEIIDHGGGLLIKAWGIQIRKKLLTILNENGLVGKEYAVVSAILLGYDDYLDADQKQQFAAAGAMHILCVSGLHVGIIYYILHLILSFLKRKKILRLLKLVLILGFIWLYASITGFSPSVLRASTMFTFIAIGSSMKQKVNIFNMLAASAFVLLAFNPFIITEVGFQLSYIAVTGILLVYKPVYNLFISRYWFVDKVWQITAVSIAATIATFPLSIFYFHQFPRFFLLTNLVAIPSAMIIIYLGIAVLVVSPVKIISLFVGKVLSFVIWFLNYAVSWIEGLSYSTASGLYLSRFELLLIYGLIVSIMALVFIKRKMYIWISLIMFVFIFSSFLIRQHQSYTFSGITLYSVKNASAIDFANKGDVVFLADSIVFTDPEKYKYNIDNGRIQSGLKRIEAFRVNDSTIRKDWFQKKGNFISFNNRTLVLVDKGFKVFPSAEKYQSDFIIYSHNPSLSIAELTQAFEFDLLIIDPSNSFWKTNELKKACNELNVDYYCVRDSGAWVCNN